MTDHPAIAKVAANLTAIEDMHARLEAEAEHRADHPLMPGGEAMVALAPVANVEAWEHRQQATERYRRAYTSVADEDPDDGWSAFQLIEFWSEAWRRERGWEWQAGDRRPDIGTEVNFVRQSLTWAWEHEPHWDDFAADMARARTRLENLLREGERAMRGAPCLRESCRGVPLVRKAEPTRGAHGEKAWRLSDWHCPRCHRSYDDDAYRRHVVAAHERAQTEHVGGELWTTLHRAATLVGRPVTTVKSWVAEGQVARLCVLAGRRVFVRLADVQEQHAATRRRTRRRGAA